jgi:hypothetical protein
VTPQRPRYQSPVSTQTLAEGLAEYRTAHPALKRDEEILSPEARQFFRSHDIVHVLYGCDTTMPDEAIVKIASLFGTTGGLGVLRGYLHHESLDIYRRLPPADTLLAILLAPYLVLRTLWRCVRQPRRWPWVEHAQYLDTSLADLRSAFGIRVAHPDARSN